MNLKLWTIVYHFGSKYIFFKNIWIHGMGFNLKGNEMGSQDIYRKIWKFECKGSSVWVGLAI